MARAIAFLVLALGSTAQAQSDDSLARARTHFEAGRALYNLKNYTDAIREFSAGYQLVPKPQFLVNLGQCYDHLAEGATGPENLAEKRDRLEHARDMYNKFLQDAAPGDPLRAQVAPIVGELERKLRALPPPVRRQEPPPTTTPPAAPVAAVAKDETPKKKSGIARFWWIIPVAAVVVVGVSLGAYYGTRPTGPDCSSASFGCIDASKPGLIQY